MPFFGVDNGAGIQTVGRGYAPAVTINQYPQELGNQQFPNMIKFFINQKAISVERSKAETVNFTADQKARLVNENRASPDSYEKVAAGSAALVAAVGTLAAGKALTGEGTSAAAKTLVVAAAAGTAAVAAALVATNQETVRLKDVISLYVPQSIISAYTANWDEVELGALGGTLGSGNTSLGDFISGSGVELVGRGAVSAAANIPAAVGVGDVNMGDVFEATSKKVENPYKEQLFKSMGFRQFSFSYQFSPKNQKEALEVQKIIQLFKQNMHPEKSESGLFLIYPAEFQIEFHTTDEKGAQSINKNLPRVSSCALKSCKITYGPDGMFNTFKNSGGMPTETSMELQFVELETMTADRIREGGF